MVDVVLAALSTDEERVCMGDMVSEKSLMNEVILMYLYSQGCVKAG